MLGVVRRSVFLCVGLLVFGPFGVCCRVISFLMLLGCICCSLSPPFSSSRSSAFRLLFGQLRPEVCIAGKSGITSLFQNTTNNIPALPRGLTGFLCSRQQSRGRGPRGPSNHLHTPLNFDLKLHLSNTQRESKQPVTRGEGGDSVWRVVVKVTDGQGQRVIVDAPT